MKKSSPLQLFRTLDVPFITFYKIDTSATGEFYMNDLARKLTNFASDNKYKTIQIRIDTDIESVAVVKCPIRNFEDLVDKTTMANPEKYPDIHYYYKQLLRIGGIAEKH